jgi:hypothetical protein
VGHENKPEQDAAEHREDFLERWSRRKLDSQRDEQAAPASESGSVPDVAPAADEPEKVLTDADMPPIETLGVDSDYSPFLSPGVSDDLRRQAMRRLFTQPDFNITDGLNDYDEDYTQFAGLGKVITHEMKRMLQRELDAGKTEAGSTEMQSGQTAEVEAHGNDVTAAAEKGDTDRVDNRTRHDDTGGNDESPG